ncbi:hypothetical protein BC830DRAFT_552896 [Chytriomyces sp. MP71]|nr:hypothetical protein BC830DRAFT_552896 [Chytriomyces sp. MP71]
MACRVRSWRRPLPATAPLFSSCLKLGLRPMKPVPPRRTRLRVTAHSDPLSRPPKRTSFAAMALHSHLLDLVHFERSFSRKLGFPIGDYYYKGENKKKVPTENLVKKMSVPNHPDIATSEDHQSASPTRTHSPVPIEELSHSATASASVSATDTYRDSIDFCDTTESNSPASADAPQDILSESHNLQDNLSSTDPSHHMLLDSLVPPTLATQHHKALQQSSSSPTSCTSKPPRAAFHFLRASSLPTPLSAALARLRIHPRLPRPQNLRP